jgi:hypothetical protein
MKLIVVCKSLKASAQCTFQHLESPPRYIPGWHETSGDDDGIRGVQSNGAKPNVVGNARVL